METLSINLFKMSGHVRRVAVSFLWKIVFTGLIAVTMSCASVGPEGSVRLAGVLLDRQTGEPVSDVWVTLEVWEPSSFFSRIHPFHPGGTYRFQEKVRTSDSGEFEFVVSKWKQYYGYNDKTEFLVDVKNEDITDLLLLHEEAARGLNCQEEFDAMVLKAEIEPLIVSYCRPKNLSDPHSRQVNENWDELVRKYGTS